VLGRALALTTAGVVAGVVLAAAAARLASTFLFAVSPTDARTFLATSALLVTVALLASWLPAWRATRTDPMRSLRSE
jgi:ABC-type antimicrobial peptide transport system permease subunit